MDDMISVMVSQLEAMVRRNHSEAKRTYRKLEYI
jgi:hypothetical protein